MNFISKIILGLIALSIVSAEARVLNIPRIQQEQSNWCWDATSLMVIHYFGNTSLTQQQVADYAVGGQNVSNYSWGAPAPDHGIDEILNNWGVSNAYVASALSPDEQNTHYNSGNPVIIRWGWNGGGGHFVLGIGITGSQITINDPWTAGGVIVADTSWATYGESYNNSSDMHTWTHSMWSTMPDPGVESTDSLVLTAPAGGASFALGDSLVMQWQTSLSGNVKLTLLPSSGSTVIVSSIAASAKRAAWKIPLSQAAGSYRVAIASLDSTRFTDTSAVFTITAPVVVDTTNPSEDFATIFTAWSSDADSYGSSALLTNGTVNVSGAFTLGSTDSSYADMTASFDTVMANGKWILISYSSDKAALLSLDQTGLSDNGESFGLNLPASSGTTICVRIDTTNFHQPDWVTSKVALDLSAVSSVSISPTVAGSTNLTVTRLVIFGTGPLLRVVPIRQRQQASLLRSGVSCENRMMHLTVPTSGLWKLSIYRPDGKLISERNFTLNVGTGIVPAPNAAGVYIARLSGCGVAFVNKVILQ